MPIIMKSIACCSRHLPQRPLLADDASRQGNSKTRDLATDGTRLKHRFATTVSESGIQTFQIYAREEYRRHRRLTRDHMMFVDY